MMGRKDVEISQFWFYVNAIGGMSNIGEILYAVANSKSIFNR